MTVTQYLRLVQVFILGSSCCSCIFCVRKRKHGTGTLRSHCEGCGRILSVTELIPVLGYFLCHGSCRFCGYRIPRIYPAAEFISGCIAVMIYVLLVYR